jgi:hypothetical protein
MHVLLMLNPLLGQRLSTICDMQIEMGYFGEVLWFAIWKSIYSCRIAIETIIISVYKNWSHIWIEIGN